MARLPTLRRIVSIGFNKTIAALTPVALWDRFQQYQGCFLSRAFFNEEV
jgi:hypothetical protein